MKVGLRMNWVFTGVQAVVVEEVSTSDDVFDDVVVGLDVEEMILVDLLETDVVLLLLDVE